MNSDKVDIERNGKVIHLIFMIYKRLVGVILNIQAILQVSGESLNITLSGIPYSIRITRF